MKSIVLKTIMLSLVLGIGTQNAFSQADASDVVKAKVIRDDHGKVIALQDDAGSVMVVTYDETASITPDLEDKVIALQDDAGNITHIEDAEGKKINIQGSEFVEIE
jgi:hypothetical protein